MAAWAGKTISLGRQQNFSGQGRKERQPLLLWKLRIGKLEGRKKQKYRKFSPGLHYL